jgi:hypothetical protein
MKLPNRAPENSHWKTGMNIARPFSDCYIPEPNSGCWLWIGATDRDGYGVTFPNIPAHRESYERHISEIPEGMHVLHKCDTRSCVNPTHFFLGTNAENMADKVKKGRQARGSKNGASRLTEAQVEAIKRDDRPLTPIAKEYGVTIRIISLIRRHELWNHMPDPDPFWREHRGAA